MKYFAYIIGLAFVASSCSDEEMQINPNDPINGSCDISQQAFMEENGLVTIDFEYLSEKNGWTTSSDVDGFLGDGYIYWNGDDYYSKPGNNLLTMPLQIENPGTYRIIWHSRILKGQDGTEHNDSWLRFPDADDFFGEKKGEFIYPKGSGKSPNPEGAGSDGWMKVYMNGSGEWKWRSSTSDNDAHDIYVTFDEAGLYTMEVSARSSFHGLDRVVLFNEGQTQQTATTETNTLSSVICR